MTHQISRAVTLVRALFVIAVLGVLPRAVAEEIRDYYAEPGLNPFKDSLNQSLNEHIDPFSGTLQLKYTDVTVPGNGGMDINITRVYTSLQNTDVPLIGITGVGWVMHFGRIVTAQRHMDKLCNQALFSASTNDNPSLELPDGGRELLVLNHIDNDGSLITRSNWKAVCVPGQTGLLVTSPDGTQYTMSRGAFFQGEPSWLTTQIEDVHGNWIRIDYATNAAGVTYIEEIYRSEEGSSTPVVTYEYERQDEPGITLSAIVANGQRWTYQYESIPGYYFDHYHHLVAVIRPDGQRWVYQYNPASEDPNPDDGIIELTPGGHSLRHMRYPFGATVDYTYQYVQFDPGSALQTTVVATKTVSGSDVPNGQWQFSFAPFSRPFTDASGRQLRLDVTTVTAPDAIYRHVHYGKDYAPRPGGGQIFIRPSYVGLLAFKEVYSRTNVLLERRAYAWTVRLISRENFWHGAGYRDWWIEEPTGGTYAPMPLGEAYSRDANAGSTTGYQHVKGYFDHDAYGNPGRIYENVNLTNQPARQIVLTYRNDTTRWILGLPLTETHQTVDGQDGSGAATVGEVTRTYFANGKLHSENRFGVETEYTYTTAGDIATVEDARGYTRRYSNYRRGIARREELPESVVLLRQVNATGTLQSETNGRGFTTSYEYDGLNRLTSINYPINADVSISYDAEGGAMRRVLTRGNYRQIELINDFGQVLRTERTDLQSNETIIKRMTYDALGRQTFVSYPNNTIGLATKYDSLGRIQRTEHPDGTGIDYTYNDEEVTVRNERRYQTKYLYRVFGINDAARQPTQITQPLAVATLIDRDIFDNTTRVWQGQLSGGDIVGYGKTYQYDSRQFLTRVSEPEVGSIVYTHDALGNVLTETVNGEPATTFTWDGLGRRVAVDFGDATHDVKVVHDRNGNVIELTKGASRWSYVYDDNDNLQSETLTLQDRWYGPRSYVLGYANNVLDVVSSVTYPSGLVVDYAPDAFGRATRVGSFASNVQYHSSGQLRSYTLGNGITTTVDLNQRLLTERIRAGGLLDLNYLYDAGGNLRVMTDGINPSQSNTENYYDELDQLESATGPWGGYYPNYDTHGNFVVRNTATEAFRYSTDTSARLAQIERTPRESTSLRELTQFAYDGRGNLKSKRFYGMVSGGQQGFVSKRETRLRFDAASNLVAAEVLTQTGAELARRRYEYDGNGMRYAERQGEGHALQHSVYGASKTLLFEDSFGECARTDYLLLGALNIAKSRDVFADATQDRDGDGLNDCIEVQLGLDPQNAADAASDHDGDGLTNLQEYQTGSSPLFDDTDGDGLSDAAEAEHGTDPFEADGDGDGIRDADEIVDPRLNPKLADSDHDGVSDDWELRLRSDPANPRDALNDFDNDGFSNRQERWLDIDPMNLGRSPARGVIAWRHDVGGGVQTLSTIGPDGSIYVAHTVGTNAVGGNARAIFPDGTLRWEQFTRASTSGPVTVAPDGTLYHWVRFNSVQVGSPLSLVYARNPDGSVRWSYGTTTDSLHSAISLGRDGQITVGGARTTSQQGVVLTLDRNGAAIGSKVVTNTVNVAPLIAPDGSMFVMSGYGTVHAYAPDGTQRWTYQLRSASSMELALGRGGVLYVMDGQGYSLALRPDGSLLWEQRYSTAAPRSSITVGDNGVLYVGTAAGEIRALRATDGGTLWSASLGNNPILTPAIGSDGTVYAVSTGGRVSAYDPTGSLSWTLLTGSVINAAPNIDKDGTLYVGTLRGQLLSIVERGGGLARAPWPMQRHDVSGSSAMCFDSDSYSTVADSDSDGIEDCDELQYGLDPNDQTDGALDLDGDGLSNTEESALSTRLDRADTDGDGLTDGQEVRTYQTDPLAVDSDGDLLADGYEVQYQFNPLDPADALVDSDGDGFSNRQERLAGTDPLNLSSAPVAGTIVATVTTSTSPVSQPAAHPNGLIFVNGPNQLQARGPDLSLRWTWPEAVEGQPVVGSNGIVYVVTKETNGRSRVVALYPDGKLWWSQQLRSHVLGTVDGPVVGNDGAVYVSYRYSDFYRYTDVAGFSADGRLLGTHSLSSYGDRPQRLSVDRQGNVLVSFLTLVSLAADMSGLNWTSDVPQTPNGNVSVPVVDSTGVFYIVRADGLYAISSAAGVVQWSNADIRGQPVLTESGLIVAQCASNGQLCALNRDGTLAWQMPGSYTLLGTPTVDASGIIHQVTSAGQYLRVSPLGQLVSQFAIPTVSSFEYPMLLGDGMVYLALPGTHMLLLNGAPGQSTSPWPAKNRDATNRRNASAQSVGPLPAGPAVSWTSPPPNFIYYGTSRVVTARALDYQDGDISSAIRWSSDVDGEIGQGANVNLQVLSAGTHTITARVQDSHGRSTSSSFQIAINHQPPNLTVYSPEPETRAEIGRPFVLRATSIDPIDGDISSGITWSSDRDGALGLGGEVSVVLSPGYHVITVISVNSFGLSARQDPNITIERVPPAVTIVAPNADQYVTEGALVSFSATAIDIVDGDLTSQIRWRSSLDGVLHTGAAFSAATLSVGGHEISAVATDSHGLIGRATRYVHVASASGNTAPYVYVYSNNGQTRFGRPVTFTADAYDPEDGTRLNVQWFSDRDGAIGAGVQLTISTLSVGAHQITALVVDTQGAKASNYTIHEVVRSLAALSGGSNGLRWLARAPNRTRYAPDIHARAAVIGRML